MIFSSALVNPVFGWSLTMLLDNLGLIGDKERGQSLSHRDRWIIPLAVFLILCAVMAAIGMFPGIPALLEAFRGGAPLATAFERAAAHDPGFDPGAALQRHVGSATLVDFRIGVSPRDEESLSVA